MESSGSAEVCCDPFKRHKKVVSKHLRQITAYDVTRNSKLVLGSFWCDNCRKFNVFEEAESHASHHEIKVKIIKKEDIAKGIDCSSIQLPRRLQALTSSIGSQESDKVCCNPYGKHSKPIYKTLREIKELDVKKDPSLTLGLFWCNNCRCAESAKIQRKQILTSHEAEPIIEAERETTADDNNLITAETRQKGSELATLFREIADELSAVDPEPNSEELGGNSNTASGASSDSISLSPATKREAANLSLKSLGLSPLVMSKLKCKGSKINATKRKIDDATAVVRKKLCRAAGVHENDLETDEVRKAQDFDVLMNAIKKKLPGSSKLQTYQLLSLVPDSMSIREASLYFNVSRTLILRVRELKHQEGILPLLNFSRNSSVPESTKVLIVKFYCDDENSKVLPGLRDSVSTGKGKSEQRRYLLNTLPELYQLFKRKHEDLKVGLSLFCSLRPKWCISAGGPGTHEQCICQIHQNFKLTMHALKIKMHYRDLIKLCVCDTLNRLCMLSLCEDCLPLDKVQQVLKNQIELPAFSQSELFSSDDEYDYFEEKVKFRQWKSTDRTELVVEVCSRSELLEVASKQLLHLIPHDFVSSSQRDYIKRLKDELPFNKVVVAMDFSMNYNCLVQGAVQSYHWSPKQATVHPSVVYYRDCDEVVKHKSLIFISDDLEHDVSLVRKFQEKTVTYIKEHFPQVDEIEYVTDGCGSQYKSKGYFINLCSHKEDFNINASHSYYATSHGKSQCDADGGTTKRKARNASLRRPFDNQIINAQDLYQFCLEEMSATFNFQFVSKEEVDPERKLHKQRMSSLETLPGTRSFHYIQPLSSKMVACWRLSNDKSDQPSLKHVLLKEVSQKEKLTVSSGTYVVARVAKNRYVAFVTDCYEEEGEADISLLLPKLPAKQYYWPEVMKTATIPLPHILCTVEPIESVQKVILSDNDVQKLIHLKIIRKQV